VKCSVQLTDSSIGCDLYGLRGEKTWSDRFVARMNRREVTRLAREHVPQPDNKHPYNDEQDL